MTGVTGPGVTEAGRGVPRIGAAGTGAVGGGGSGPPPPTAIPVVFTTLTRLTNTGNETYTATAAGTSTTAQGIIEGLASLPGQDAYIKCRRSATGTVSSVLAFDTVGSNQTFGLNDYIAQLSAAGTIFQGQNTASLTTTGVTIPEGNGCEVRLFRRVNDTVTIDTTVDGGATWTTIFTFSGTVASILRAHFYTTFSTFARTIDHPQQLGLMADFANIKFMADGNSQTVGINGAALSFPGLLGTSLGKAVVNFAVGGQSTVDMLADAATQVDAAFQNGMNVLVVGEVRNDLSNMGSGADARVAVDRFWSYCAGRRAAASAAGKLLKIVVWNTLPTTRTTSPLGVAGLNAKFNEANAFMAAEWHSYADAYVDVRLIPELLDPDNLTYYDDQVHLTAAGDAKLVVPIDAAVRAVLV